MSVQDREKAKNKTEVFKSNKWKKEVNQVLLPYTTKTKVTLADIERQLPLTLQNLGLTAAPEAKRLHRLKTILEVLESWSKTSLNICFEGYVSLSVSMDNRSCKAFEKKKQSGKFSNIQIIVIK